jgi:hypothetical protein
MKYVVVILETQEAIGPFTEYSLAVAYKERMKPLYDCKIMELRPTRVMRMS